jgi:four helix bundle protein
MASIKRFEDVEAWKQGRELTRRIYQITSQSKFTRDYALRDQIRRAAISITSNIAEGFDRGGNREFVQFLAIARGSASELKSQLYTALDAGYVDQKEFAELYQLAHSVVLLIGGFIKYLQQSELSGQKFKTATQRKTLNPEP